VFTIRKVCVHSKEGAYSQSGSCVFTRKCVLTVRKVCIHSQEGVFTVRKVCVHS